MAGRKPISNELKVLKGTNQPCRMRDEVRYERITKIPNPPKYFNNHSKRIYKITAQELAKKGILDVVNINAVIMYAGEMGKYMEAQEILAEEGRILTEITKFGEKKYRNPLDKMSSEYYANAIRLACELGVTPASASKVKEKPREEKDEFDNINAM
jgi:P27 family predicted phage terminase small subunit